MDEPEIPQTDTAADPSSGDDDLQSLLDEFQQATARPAAGNGHAESSADGADQSQVRDPAETPGDGDDIDWLLKQHELYNREMDLRVQRVELDNKERVVGDALQTYIATVQQARHEADLKDTIAQVRGGMDSKFFDDRFVTAFIDKEARDKPELQELWLNRHTNPRALATAVKDLAKNFQKTYSRMPDADVTADVAMVAQAIRGASGPTPVEPPPNYARMSNPELREEMKKMGINPTF